jgi:hypothetical protein
MTVPFVVIFQLGKPLIEKFAREAETALFTLDQIKPVFWFLCLDNS